MLNKPRKIDRELRALRERFFIDTPRPGLLEWLTPPMVFLGRWLDVLLLEKRKWISLPWKHRLQAWRHGFTGFSWRLYELAGKSPGDYLSDVAGMRFGNDLNGRYTDAVFSKVVFSRMLKSLDAPQPTLLGMLLRGVFYPEAGPACAALPGIRGLLEQGGKLVLRPSFGGGGTGILFLELAPTGYRVNSLPADQETFERLVEPLHDYLVTRYVNQAAYAAEIFPGSTNTLRILTLWDCAANAPFIAAACHRFGRTASGPLDNFHAGAGGLSVPIDIASGVLGQAVMRESWEIRRISHHPDTGMAIAGVVVPDWHRTMEELLALAARLPYTPCIGWDLVKLEQGWTCLEGNPIPGYHVWQVHGPLLRDPRARRFYREFGMIR